MEENSEQPKEQPAVEQKTAKDGFNFFKWIKGKNSREYVENISFVIILISGIMVASGIVMGSFIQGTILIASFGSMFVMIGIVTYIISQFIGVDNG